MPNSGLPKVTQYVKNVGKSIAFATISAVSENTEGIRSFAEDNQEIFTEMYSSVKNYRETIKKAEAAVKKSNVYKAVDYGIKNILDDIKTGNFYNDRSYDISETALGLDDESLGGMDFNYEVSNNNDSEESFSDSFNQAIGAAATAQSTVVAQSTDLIIKTNKASTSIISAQLDRTTATLSSGIGAVYTAIDRTNQFLNGPMLRHLENSKAYYENSLKIMQDQQAMIKELLEMQRNLYKAKDKDYRYSKLEESMSSNGSVNLKGYMKNIKSNINELMDNMGLSMLDLSGDSGMNPLMLFAAAPMKMVMDNLMQKILPKNFKSNLKSLDSSVTTLFSQLVARMNNAKENEQEGILGSLAQIFGVKVKNKTNINPGNYNKGAVPFDGIVRQSIIEVIPGYLARIEASLTGASERYYDYNRGTWKSANQIHKEFDDEKLRAISSANMDIRLDMQDALSKMTAENANAMELAMHRAMEKLYDDYGDLKADLVKVVDQSTNRKYYRSSDNSEAWLDYGFDSKKQFDTFLENLKPETIKNLASRNMSSREQYSKDLEWHEANGSIYSKLFNGTWDSTGSGSSSRKDPTKFNATRNLLSLSKDEHGHNVFYYLREILSNIRSGGNRVKYQGAESNPNNKPAFTPTGTSKESETSSESEDDPRSFDNKWRTIESKLDEEAAEEYKKAKNKNKVGNWINSTLNKSAIGRFFNKAAGGVSTIISSPLKFATELLEKANDNMFKMMFGEGKDYSNIKKDNGDPINNVFEYMIYKVDKSFKELTDKIGNSVKNMWNTYIQPFIDERIKPLWNEYGKPVTDEVGNMFKSGWNRVKTGFGNTFGKGFNTINDAINKAKNGQVASADEVTGTATTEDINDPGVIQQNAFGTRLVTKRGLTMISPGEMIIPASSDTAKLNNMLAAEKRDKNRILGALGSKNIGLHAKGTIDTEELKKKLYTIYQENTGEKAAKVGAGGLVGGLAGLLTGINPLLGAAAGAGISILNNSETLKNAVFGKEIGENGEREGGIIPKKIYDIFKKAAPDMGDFGIAGGLLGLFTPFGPLGGAAIGAGVGFLKNSESFKKFIFGDEASGKEGIIKKESFDKFKDHVKKAAPNMLIGAGAGILAGPFGLLGNAAMGAGLGLVTSTDEFHSFLFGTEDSSGLLSAFQNGILEPAKTHILEIITDFKDYAKENIIDPMKRFWEPFKQDLRNIIQGTFDKVKDHLNDMFEKTIGLPMADFLQEKIFKPVTNTLFKIIKAPINIGKAIVSAPFKALGLIGDSRRTKQIRKGNAYDMSASERLAYRDQHNIRFLRRDKMRTEDEMLANMEVGDLEALASNARAGLDSYSELQNRAGKAKQAIGQDISGFFNEKNENGASRYSKVNYKLVKKLSEIATDGDIDGAYEMIDGMNLTDDEKESLKKKIEDKVKAAKKANDDMELARKGTSETDKQLSKLLNRKINGRKDRRQIFRSVEAELRSRKKAIVDETPEEHATNNLTEIYSKKSESILTQLIKANEYLKALVDPESAANDTESASNKEAKNKAMIEGKSGASSESSSTELAKDATDSSMKSPDKKKSLLQNVRNVFDQVTGRFISSNPDAKENVENDEIRKQKDLIDKENSEANKKTNTILGKMGDFFFGKKNNGEEKDGILSKLFSGAKKFGKFIGIGGLALTGISFFGHASEWFKTSVWPKIKECLFGKTSEDGTTVSEGMVGGLINKGKSLLFGEDGQSGLVGKLKTILLGEKLDGKGGLAGWLNEKFISPVTGFFDRVKNLWDANGGLSGIISGVLLPKLVAGWGYTMNNVITPVVALVVKHLPSMLASLGTAIFNGIKIALNKDIKRNSNSEAINPDPALSEYKTQADTNNNKFIAALDSAVIKLFSTNSSAYSSSTNTATIDYGSLLDDNYATKDQTYDAYGNHLNKTSDEIMYKKAPGVGGLLGAKNATNDIYYDENGNIGLDSYKTWNTSNSIGSSIANVTGKGFLRGLVGANPGTGLAKLMTKASTKGAGHGIFKTGTGLLGGLTKGTGNVVNAGANAGKGINNMIQHGIDISNVNKEFAKTVSEAGGGSVDDILKQIHKSSIDDVAKNLYNSGDEALGLVADTAANRAKNNIGIIDTFYNTASKTADDVAEAGAKSADNLVSKGMQAISNAAGNAKDNIASKIVSVFTSIADSKIFGTLLKACSAETTETMLREAIDKLAKKLGDNIVGNLTEKALGKVASVLGKFSPVTIVFWIADFYHGYDNADTILGVAKGDEYKVNFGQKCLCGLLNLINNQITLGLLPTDVIVDIIVEFLFPLFGLDAESLNAARDRADDILDEWNAAHPEETYSNLEDFNNKDKWTTKVKKSVSTGWENFKTGAKNTWENVKTGAGNLWEGAKTTVGNAIDGIKEFGSGIWEKVSPYVESIKGIPTLIGNLVKDAINYGKTDEHIDGALDIPEDDPLIGLKKGIVSVGKVMTFPLAMFTKAFTQIKEKVFDPLISGVKEVGGNVITGVGDIFTNAWKGDLNAAFGVSVEANEDGSGLTTGISNVILGIVKAVGSVPILLTSAVGTVKRSITAFIDGAKQIIPVVATATKQRNDAAWHPELEQQEGIGVLQSTGNETLDTIANVVLKITDVFNTPSRLLGKAFNTVKTGVTAFIDGAKLVLTNVATATKQRNDAAWHPDQEQEEGAGELESTGNETLDTIANVVLKITDVFNTPSRLLGKAFNTVKTGITVFIDGAKQIIPLVATATKERNDAAWNPDEAEEDAGELESTGNETLDTIANVVLGITDVFNTPSRLLGKAFNSVKDGIESVISKYSVSQETKKADDTKIERALNGEISVFSKEYWTNADHDDEGIFGIITNVQTYIEKVMNAPMIIIKGIVNKVTEAFEGIQEWFGDKFGGIWEWITGFFTDNGKDEATNTLTNGGNTEVANTVGQTVTGYGRGRSNRKNRYGLGHAYQSSELISSIPYGDSTIGESGCAPVAATNLLNSISPSGDAMSVAEAAKYAERNKMTVRGGGTDIKYFNSFLGSKGIPTTNTSNKSTVMDALRQGNQVIMLGKDDNDRPGTPFGSTPHYVTAKAISSNGNIIAEDPDLPNGSVEYNPNDMMGSMITSVIANTSPGKKRRSSKKPTSGRARKASAVKKAMGKIYYGLGNMLGAQAIINVAKSQVGVEEGPGPNECKYNYAYWNNGPSAYTSQDNFQWCVVFVWWVFNQAGAAKLFCDGGKTAFVSNSGGGLNGWYATRGKYDKQNPKPGDIVILDDPTDGDPDHAGIVEAVNGNIIRIIDGNCNLNGSPGCVANRDIDMSIVHGFCHIDYPYEYDGSTVVDMSKYGDTTDYEAIARNGGSMDVNSTSSNSGINSTSSSGGTLLNALSNLGSSMVRAVFGDSAYNALFGNTTSNVEVSDGTSVNSETLTGSTDGQKIWNYLISKGYSKAGAAGIMGNLYAESGLKSNNLQNSYESSLGSDDTYTTKVNNKSYNKNSFANDDAGYGLAQWTYHTRKKALYEHTVENGKNIDDLGGQLDFLTSEFKDRYTDMDNMLKTTTDQNEASDSVLENYERPAVLNYDARRAYAKNMMDTYGSGRKHTTTGRSTSNYGKARAAASRGISKYHGGAATRALNNLNSGYSDIDIAPSAYSTNTAGAVDYQIFLQTIVDILMSIAGNTALLSKILEILSTKLDIDVNRDEIAKAAANSRAQTEQALNDIINRNGGAANMSKVLNNKDTSYLLSAMTAIASE